MEGKTIPRKNIIEGFFLGDAVLLRKGKRVLTFKSLNIKIFLKIRQNTMKKAFVFFVLLPFIFPAFSGKETPLVQHGATVEKKNEMPSETAVLRKFVSFWGTLGKIVGIAGKVVLAKIGITPLYGHLRPLVESAIEHERWFGLWGFSTSGMTHLTPGYCSWQKEGEEGEFIPCWVKKGIQECVFKIRDAVEIKPDALCRNRYMDSGYLLRCDEYREAFGECLGWYNWGHQCRRLAVGAGLCAFGAATYWAYRCYSKKTSFLKGQEE